jgi:RNA polymerase sigma-70 factor (ECF subfamily)
MPTFEEIYEVDGPRIVAELYGVTGSLAEAEDAVQEAFIRAYARWSRVGRLDKPAAWVRRVAFNLVTSRWRALRRAARLAPRIAVPDAGQSVEEGRDWLVGELARLPERQRVAIVLHYWADLPVADIAEVMGQPVSTVKSHLRRGRAALAMSLDETEEVPGGTAR